MTFSMLLASVGSAQESTNVIELLNMYFFVIRILVYYTPAADVALNLCHGIYCTWLQM